MTPSSFGVVSSSSFVAETDPTEERFGGTRTRKDPWVGEGGLANKRRRRPRGLGVQRGEAKKRDFFKTEFGMI